MQTYEVSGTKVTTGVKIDTLTLRSGDKIKFNVCAIETDQDIGEYVQNVKVLPTRSGKNKLRDIGKPDGSKDAIIILHGYCCYRGSNRVSWNGLVTELVVTHGKASRRGSLGVWSSHVLLVKPGGEIKHQAFGRRADSSDIQYIMYDGSSVVIETEQQRELL